MPSSSAPYPPEFRRKIIAVHQAGRSNESLPREFGSCANTIASWTKQTDLDDSVRGEGLTTDERTDLPRRFHKALIALRAL